VGINDHGQKHCSHPSPKERDVQLSEEQTSVCTHRSPDNVTLGTQSFSLALPLSLSRARALLYVYIYVYQWGLLLLHGTLRLSTDTMRCRQTKTSPEAFTSTLSQEMLERDEVKHCTDSYGLSNYIQAAVSWRSGWDRRLIDCFEVRCSVAADIKHQWMEKKNSRKNILVEWRPFFPPRCDRWLGVSWLGHHGWLREHHG
jgi:hypothetical protein